MAHGDDDGLRVPPHLAPVQVVVLAVRDEGDVVSRCHGIADTLRAEGVRVHVDDKAAQSMGRRATDWELKGVPLRLEIGPRDLADEQATLVRRITGGDGYERKLPVALDTVTVTVVQELERQQAALLAEAHALREARTVEVASLEEAREAAGEGWARVPWDLLGEPGETVLAQGGVTVRCLTRADGSLPASDAEPDLVATVARAY